MQQRTWVEISTGAIEKNIKGYRKILPKNAGIMAVIKANAYGHDLNIVADAAVNAGVDCLAVFTMDDALSLRKKHAETQILVLKQIEEFDLDRAIKNNIDITVSSVEMLKKVAVYKNKNRLLINLKVDTGLTRQGFLFSELDTVLELVTGAKDLQVVSLYTHLIGAENKKFDAYTKSQAESLKQWQKVFNEAGYFPLLHTSATSGYLMDPDLAFDVVRIGIGIYGLWPSDEVREISHSKLKLHEALSWKTKISEIKTIKRGTVVGYNATFEAKNDMKVAILPIGYFDGLPRSISGKGYMLCGGMKCPILGRVMMNMCVIDVTGVKNAKAGDVVTVIGQDRKEAVSADDLAIWAETINYEIVTRINSEIPRIAIK